LVFKGFSLRQISAELLSFCPELVDLDGDVLSVSSSLPNADMGKGVKQPKNIQQPQNHGDYHDTVQDGLDG
jgi:hypothetical protein